MTDILKEGKFWKQTCKQGEHHVNIKAEMTVMLLQVEEHQRLPEKP